MIEQKPIQVGEDRVIISGTRTAYRIKPLYKDFYFTLGEVVKILSALPFSFSIQPLNYDHSKRRFDDKNPSRHLVEVFPKGSTILRIYPPNFRMIDCVTVNYKDGLLNLRPSCIMDDIEGGFRCSYFPTLKDMGLENKVITPRASGLLEGEVVKAVEVDIHKFSEHDGWRIHEYRETLTDDSEEARMYSQLAQILKHGR